MFATEPRLFVVRRPRRGDNREMARTTVGCVLLWALASCGGSEALPPPDNVLELELGGQNRPLGPALRAVDASYRAAPDPGEGQAPEPVVPATFEPPRVVETTRTVALTRGQTVYDLAREELGSAVRWKEILELNGWTEEQAKRLRVGAEVKLPLR